MKNKMKFNKPSKRLDGDSAEMLAALEAGAEIESLPQEKKKLKNAARAYFQKDARVSLRLSSVDLSNIKRLAAEEGLPYQSYISSMLHKVTTGKLIESRP